MQAWTVLMDFAKQPEGGRCPFGLLLPVDHGNGAICRRCEGKAGHEGPHVFATAYSADLGVVTHVKVEWYNDLETFPIWKLEDTCGGTDAP
jgi:hypothetical protein